MSEQDTSAARKLPRQDRARLTVDVILTATKRVLAEGGRGQATTNRIAEVAGVSIGSLYQYFPNKDALIDIVQSREKESFREHLEPRFEAMFDLSLREAAHGIVGLLIDYHRDARDIHSALQEPAQPDFHDALADRWLPIIVSYLEEHRDEIRPTNLTLAARIALEAVEALTHEMSLRSPELLEDAEYASELGELLLGYLERRPTHR